MAFKFVAMFALLAAVSAQHYGYNHGQNVHAVHAPVYHSLPAHAVHHYEPEAPAKYEFDYSVHDTTTGDIKLQKESRDGDRVVGQYSLVDADGLHRIVDYTADDVNGFQATVRREPITKPLEPIHHSAPVVHHAPAPIAHHYAPAPVVHHVAPVVYQHSAPVAHHVVSHVAPAQHSAGHVSYNTAGAQYHY